MKLSVIIPAYNEAGCVAETLSRLADHLAAKSIEYEIVVINDYSSDNTESVLAQASEGIPGVRYVNNPGPGGFGMAVRRGLDVFEGDAVAIYMADGSDRPEDLVRFWHTLLDRDVDCVFGSRFIRGGRTVDYPPLKLIVNRMANHLIRVLFGLRYNDITNAFKLYRRPVIEGLKPFLSPHFNLTVELPLKAIVRGYSYTVVPNEWINRKSGVSKLRIQEMGSRYLFIVLYCLIEKWLSRGDYRHHR
jgi:dolichol-phosphate mannosyltransferase